MTYDWEEADKALAEAQEFIFRARRRLRYRKRLGVLRDAHDGAFAALAACTYLEESARERQQQP